MTSAHAAALRAYVGAFADELVRAGVSDVVMCPGSRSTPLALVLRRQPGFRTWMHLDERSAAFFALGLARGSGRPAAVVATSGTAAVNFAPAVVEALQGFVPLLVLTADRPAELHGIGSTQTIDQTRLFGPHVKWSEEMLLPEPTPAATRYVRAIADRAVATALAAPMGPVHLNFPFREPLIPAAAEVLEAGAAATVRVHDGVKRADPAFLQQLAEELRGPSRGSVKGLIVCGGQDDAAFGVAARRLSRDLGFPLLADALSQTRCGAELGGLVIDCFDAFLRDPETVAELQPDVILRFGAAPVSKPLSQYLERYTSARQIVVGEAGTWLDPQQSASEFVFAEPTAFCEDLNALFAWREESGPWINRWIAVNQIAATALADEMGEEEHLSEGGIFRRLARLLPAGAIVFAGNSMPVRDLDSFFPASSREYRILCNRGASGIDGVTSAALGVAAATKKPLVLVTGDISFYHDMNGLLAAQRYGDELNATIVVINNDGGGIFSFLPQKQQEVEDYEELFGTPHGLDFRHAAALYGLDYTLTKSAADFDTAVSDSARRNGVSIIEVPSDRDANLARHNQVWARLAERLRQARG